MARRRDSYAPAFLNCGGIGQPPYCVKWRGRWWLTEWVSAPRGLPQASADVLAFVRALGPLPFGMARFRDYLGRTGKRAADVPILNGAALAKVKGDAP